MHPGIPNYKYRKTQELITLGHSSEHEGVFEAIEQQFDTATGEEISPKTTHFTLQQLADKRLHLMLELDDVEQLLEDANAITPK